jgi:hypothetical protein
MLLKVVKAWPQSRANLASPGKPSTPLLTAPKQPKHWFRGPELAGPQSSMPELRDTFIAWFAGTQK